MVNVAAIFATSEEEPVQDAWVTEFAAALRQGDAGAYVNFLADEGEERVRAAYPDATWERLIGIKHRYDPGEPVPTQPEHPAGSDQPRS
jgi:hypothetical protein